MNIENLARKQQQTRKFIPNKPGYKKKNNNNNNRNNNNRNNTNRNRYK